MKEDLIMKKYTKNNTKELRTKVSEILVKWNMPTRQVAINEIVALLSPKDSIKDCKYKLIKQDLTTFKDKTYRCFLDKDHKQPHTTELKNGAVINWFTEPKDSISKEENQDHLEREIIKEMIRRSKLPVIDLDKQRGSKEKKRIVYVCKNCKAELSMGAIQCPNCKFVNPRLEVVGLSQEEE